MDKLIKARTEWVKLLEFGSTTTGKQRSLHRCSAIDGQFFRQLTPNECLALPHLKNWACDDVLITQPLFVKNEEFVLSSTL